MTAYKNNNSSPSRFPATRWLVGLLLLLAILGGGYTLLHIHNVRQAQRTNGKVANVTKQNQKTNISADKDQVANTTPSPDKSNQSTTSSGSVDAQPPITPSGTFVSNHHPGDNGAPTSEQSVCNTSVAATCDIILTSASGVVKNLGSKTTDSNGAAYWQWDVKGANLAPGEWTISAKATLNGQTATASDSLRLEVQ